MKKNNFKFYVICWALFLALFNVVSFVSVGWAGQEKYTASFWIGYILITLAFVGQLVCAYFALNKDSADAVFYRISIVTISYSALIASLFVGGICMLIPRIPYFVGVIVCAAILAFFAIWVFKAGAAAELVEGKDDEIKQKTQFVKSMTVQAQNLLSMAKDAEAQSACRKVYEAIRYSDPTSNDSLADIESRITEKFTDLAEALQKQEGVSEAANELIGLINNRNQNCKILK